MKRRPNARRVLIGALCVLIAGMTLFIHARSLKSPAASMSESGRLVTISEPVIKPVIEAVTHKEATEEQKQWAVRKAAHFAEYALLGALWAGLCAALMSGGKRRALTLLPYLACLFTAVTDETLQSFVGRTSSAADVLIDFAGAFGAALVLTLIVKRILRVSAPGAAEPRNG